MKATAIAPANVGLIKYWGRKDENLRLPENGSISFNLSGLTTITTVEFSENLVSDEILINKNSRKDEVKKVRNHLDRIRKLAGISQKAKVVSQNSFPKGTGLSSSSSGFASLTLAATLAAGLKLAQIELSRLSRLGSGSACRSIPDGFVEWLEGNSDKSSYAVSLYPPDYWDIADVIALVSDKEKDVSSSSGQKLVKTSFFYPTRLTFINEKIKMIKEFIKDRNFTKFGELIEAEALELHAIMLTSIPSLIYWTCGTIMMMNEVKKWRSGGLEVYFTINTGQNIHLICKRRDADILVQKVKKIKEVKNVIVSYPSIGARPTKEHLF